MRFCFAKFENVFGPFWFEARERERNVRGKIGLLRFCSENDIIQKDIKRERERAELLELELESELEGKTTGKGIQYKVANLL